MTTCRVCGASCAPEDLLGVQDGGGCRGCNGSPACARCGHPRRHHRGTFGGGAARCDARIPIEATLALARCGCEGYTTDGQTYGEPVELVDVVEFRLRLPGEHPAPQPKLAPVRDLFDSERGIRGVGEAKPWRPPR